nr:MAG TPA_asm: tail protein [Bacteriophage sp.]
MPAIVHLPAIAKSLLARETLRYLETGCWERLMKIYAMQGDTLDAVCARFYGRTAGVVEAVLKANPGLAELGVILPHGTPVEMPEVNSAPTKESVNLWD